MYIQKLIYELRFTSINVRFIVEDGREKVESLDYKIKTKVHRQLITDGYGINFV